MLAKLQAPGKPCTITCCFRAAV